MCRTKIHSCEHMYVRLTPYNLHFLAVPNTGTGTVCPDSSYPPIVVAAITAANTLLLVASLATFIASCFILMKAKRGKADETIHDYEAVDDVIKDRMVKVDTRAVPVCENVDDLSLSTQSQYQDLQIHSTENPQYAAVTTCCTTQ